VLKVGSEEELKRLFAEFESRHVPCALVVDAGLTQLEPGTVTALGVGPWKSEEIDALTQGLKLM